MNAAVSVSPVEHKFHPACALFPMMTDDEIRALGKDIQRNGQHISIKRLPDGQIIDGRNRLAACAQFNIQPWIEDIEIASPYTYTVSLNLQHRHLSASQRAWIAKEALPMLRVEARARQGNWKCNKTPSPTIFGSNDPHIGRSRDLVAQLFNVGGASVQRAQAVDQAIKSGTLPPALASDIRIGKTTVSAAYRGLKGTKAPTKERKQPEQTPAPVYPKVRLNAIRHRMDVIVGGITGYCDGLENYDMRLVYEACRERAQEIAERLRNVRKTLDRYITLFEENK